jgi:hypothetical protein
VKGNRFPWTKGNILPETKKPKLASKANQTTISKDQQQTSLLEIKRQQDANLLNPKTQSHQGSTKYQNNS